MDDIERARQILRALELRNSKSLKENALRVLCIQELLEDTRKVIEVKVK